MRARACSAATACQLAIFFWMLSPLDAYSKAAPHEVLLAIFFWMLYFCNNFVYIEHNIAKLAIFFWMLSAMQLTLVIPEEWDINLLFSFECCHVTGNHEEAGAGAVELAIFFWMLYIPSERVCRARWKTLLFSFECCSLRGKPCLSCADCLSLLFSFECCFMQVLLRVSRIRLFLLLFSFECCVPRIPGTQDALEDADLLFSFECCWGHTSFGSSTGMTHLAIFFWMLWDRGAENSITNNWL